MEQNKNRDLSDKKVIIDTNRSWNLHTQCQEKNLSLVLIERIKGVYRFEILVDNYNDMHQDEVLLWVC